MAHVEQKAFCERIKEKYPEYFKNKKVLDIGSLDLNGNNRFLFENCTYIGLDVGEGNNVDVVSTGHLYDAPDNYFDTIISTEVFEHDMFYEKTIQNIVRMLKPGGLFLFTCAAPGRPEHGTRRFGQFDAPLLIQISEEWADYYKNLAEQDIRKTPNFDNVFPDGHFELRRDVSIPADLYFYGIKGGSKYNIDSIIPEFSKNIFKEDIFVIDCWPDNDSKEKNLIDLIKRLKVFNIPILLTGHYPVKPEIQRMVDFYLYDKQNSLLLRDKFNEYDVHSVRWTEMGNIRVENEQEYHHDYAIWETMKNSFNFCKYLGKKYIHFLEYDNLPEAFQYRQSFIEQVKKSFDAILYEYDKDSSKNPENPYVATYIFSIKTDIALSLISQINTKEEFFKDKPNGWQLERNFLGCLKKITSNFFISQYIPNENELNMQAAWNRAGIDRKGTNLQLYLGVDDENNLYLHTISDHNKKESPDDYLLEILYNKSAKFYSIPKNTYLVNKIGKYKKGYTVRIYYQGHEIFAEFLSKDVDKYQELNRVIDKSGRIKEIPDLIKQTPHTPEKINIFFIDGPFVEIIDPVEHTYRIQFVNERKNEIVYELDMKNNHWAKCSKKYYIDWLIKIQGIDVKFNLEYRLNLITKRVLICFESKSLGDSIAWIPYAEKFRIEKQCEVICSTFYNNLFKIRYPEITFVEPGTEVHNIHALYRIGLFYDNNRKINFDYHETDPKALPLTKIASDILGLRYEELKPRLPVLTTKKKKMITLAIHGTAQCKYWNNSNGWQEVVDFINQNGYEARLLSREHDGYMGNINPKGVTKMPSLNTSIEEILMTIQESQLFIGISSGLAWIAWGTGIDTILISGFTNEDIEPHQGIRRIINKDVCNGCWSKYVFDPGDWNWCPVHKNTERQFECSKQILSAQVIEQIKLALKL